MAVRTALLNGNNINLDSDFSKYIETLTTPGIIEGFECTRTNVGPGKAWVGCQRTNGETIYVYVENTENLPIDGTDGYVVIQVPQAMIDDGTNNPEDGTGIATIGIVSSLPSSNYIQLGHISNGVFEDLKHLAPRFVYGGIAGGTGSALTLSVLGYTQYRVGHIFWFLTPTALLPGVTLNVSGLGAKPITKSGNAGIEEGDVGQNQILYVAYDGQNFQVVNSFKQKQGGTLFGDGSDGALTVPANTTCCLEAKTWNFTSVKINSGAKLCFCGSGTPIIKVLTCFCNLGTIDLRNRTTDISGGAVIDSSSGMSFQNKRSKYPTIQFNKGGLGERTYGINSGGSVDPQDCGCPICANTNRPGADGGATTGGQGYGGTTPTTADGTAGVNGGGGGGGGDCGNGGAGGAGNTYRTYAGGGCYGYAPNGGNSGKLGGKGGTGGLGYPFGNACNRYNAGNGGKGGDGYCGGDGGKGGTATSYSRGGHGGNGGNGVICGGNGGDGGNGCGCFDGGNGGRGGNSVIHQYVFPLFANSVYLGIICATGGKGGNGGVGEKGDANGTSGGCSDASNGGNGGDGSSGGDIHVFYSTATSWGSVYNTGGAGGNGGGHRSTLPGGVDGSKGANGENGLFCKYKVQ